jgi:hypothetical protein
LRIGKTGEFGRTGADRFCCTTAASLPLESPDNEGLYK